VCSADAIANVLGQTEAVMSSDSPTTRRRHWLDRLRRFWAPAPAPDHPLTDEERAGRPESRVDEAARRIVDKAVDTDLD
jgi:hypothetical protein